MRPKKVTLRDCTEVTIRPEAEGDMEPVWIYFSTLSDESNQNLPIPITRERVEGWFEDIDYEKALPILGFVEEDGVERVIAATSLNFSQMDHDKHIARFGISVHDDYQGRGLGRILANYMIDIARERGMKKIALEVVAHNTRAISLYESLGYVKEGRLVMNHWNRILKEYGDEYVMGLIL
jgi:ribosomal protein S18 acetylase RimI-like enzyme